LSYPDILAAYYGGLRPTHYDEPSVIRIGIATGLKSVTVQPTGDVAVVGAEAGPGPWLLTGGKHLQVRHGKRVPTYIARGSIVEAPARARVGATVRVTASVPQLSVARVVFAAPGTDVTAGQGATVEPGTVVVSGRVPDLPPGTYKLKVELTNGTDIVRTQARQVVVTGGTVPSESPSPSATSAPPPSTTSGPVALAPTRSSRTGVVVAAAVAGLVLVCLALLLLVRRRAARRFRHASSWPR
jgi:hypothetical protein